MVRYIDCNKLAEMVEAKADTLIEGKEAFLYVKKWLDLLPTADVVPRSEVEQAKREIAMLQAQIRRLKAYDEERDIALHQRLAKEAEQEVAREIVAEIEQEIKLALDSNYKARNNNGYGEFGEYVNGKIHALRGIDDFIAELRKKYIGE